MYLRLAHPSSHSLFECCKSTDHLRQIHAFFIRKCLSGDPVVCSKIIAFCCEHDSGDMNYALHVFETMPEPNVVVWNTMIKGYSRAGSPGNAVSLYLEMLKNSVKPDNYTFPFLLKAFTPEIAMALGKGLHAHVCKLGFNSNESVTHSLIRMYFMCGKVHMARGVFDRSAKRDVLIWNVMISGLNKFNRFEESRGLFCEMEEKGIMPTAITLVSLLSAFSKLKDLEAGKRVHQYVKDCEVESNIILDNALMDMYAGCGEMDAVLGIFYRMKKRDVISWTSVITGFISSGQMDLARAYFDKMPERDSVSWTAMIDGYVKENQFKEVLVLFREMQAANVKPDEFTMVSILTACAHLGALELGEWVRAYIDKNMIKFDLFLANALIDMYFKCGDVGKAVAVFDRLPRRDKFTWTAMIVGLAVNGHGQEALDIFSQMLRSSSETPDDVTYVGVLCACTHVGMVEEGRKFFISMSSQYGIEPNVTHYGCLVDLLGRAGHLTEALEVIKNMPMKPNTVVWGALLAACRVHKDAEMAEMAASQLLQLEPENGAVYVLLCNIYAACKKWENLRQLRRTMMDKGIRKTPGCSLIEVNGFVHEFVAGDQSHFQSGEIYSKMEEVVKDLRNISDYVPDTSEVSLDVGDQDEKEKSLFQHSEKLAVVFALMSSGPGVTIRIVKNLRICVDCHNFMKFISRVYDRKVIVRDRTRFHHFMNGSCSCKGYW